MKYTGRFLLNDAGACGAFALVPGATSRSHTFVRVSGKNGGRSALEFKDLTKEAFDALVKDIYGYPRPRLKAIFIEVDITDTAPLEAMIEGLQSDVLDRTETIAKLKSRIQDLEAAASRSSAFPSVPPQAPAKNPAPIDPPATVNPPGKKRHAKRKATAKA